MKFVKFNNFWWEYDESTPKNCATLLNLVGGHHSGNNITNCQIVEANGFEFLDWSGTSVLNNNSKYGWLDTEGNFYGCDYEDHDIQAELVHHSSRRELEKKGWIHISVDMMHHTGKAMAYFCGNLNEGVLPTEKQLFYLVNHKEIDSNQVFCEYEKGLEKGKYKKRFNKELEKLM